MAANGQTHSRIGTGSRGKQPQALLRAVATGPHVSPARAHQEHQPNSLSQNGYKRERTSGLKGIRVGVSFKPNGASMAAPLEASRGSPAGARAHAHTHTNYIIHAPALIGDLPEHATPAPRHPALGPKTRGPRPGAPTKQL